MASLSEKRAAFRSLHKSGCFVMPNPWDAGSAKYLASLGFAAIATTSTGFAWSRGLADGQVSLDMVLGHVAELACATDLPLNVDFEAGFATTAQCVGESVRRCIEAGASGLSIEDFPGPGASALYPIDIAIDRLRAARAAIDGSGSGVVLTARSEGFLRGAPDLDETIRRLNAYTAAGADCVYAPGIRTEEHIRAIVGAVAPKPVNVLVAGPAHLGVSELRALGVRRISVGSALAGAAWGGFMRAAKEVAEQGTFKSFASNAAGADVVKAFR